MKHSYSYPPNTEGQTLTTYWDSEDETAYHEAAHIIGDVAARIKLLPYGMAIFERPDESKALEGYAGHRDGDLDDPVRRKAVLVGLMAGARAQDKQFPAEHRHASRTDVDKFYTILDKYNRQPSPDEVFKGVDDLLDKHWTAVEVLAKALLAKPWESADFNTPWMSDGRPGRVKRLPATEILTILCDLGLEVELDLT